MSNGSEITRRLRDWSQGDQGALDQVVAAVYDELSAIARRQLRGESPGHTLDTSAVVHEAYLCLRDADGIEWKNRQHFFGVAGRIMRRVLVRYARDRLALKRGAGARHVPLSQALLFTDPQIEQIVALDELMEGLDALGPRCRSVVESRVFAGMTLEETATFLDVSLTTVKRDWKISRAWLNDALDSTHRESL